MRLIQTAIRMPEDLHRELKIEAAKNRESMQDIIIQAIRNEIEKRKQSQK